MQYFCDLATFWTICAIPRSIPKYDVYKVGTTVHTSFDNKSSSTSTMLTTQDSLPLGLKKLQWKQQKLSGRHENHSVFAQSNNLKTFLMHKFNELIFFRKKLYFIHFNNTYIEFSKSILISSYIFHDLKLMHMDAHSFKGIDGYFKESFKNIQRPFNQAFFWIYTSWVKLRCYEMTIFMVFFKIIVCIFPQMVINWLIMIHSYQ